MNANFQKLAIWVAVLVLLAALFNLFNNPAQGRRGTEISYSDFLSAVDAGTVAEVTLAGNRVYGTMRDNASAFTTYAPEDQGLVERLEKKGVKFKARPSDEDVPSIMNVILNWFPMLLLIAVWVFFMRQMQSGSGRAMGFGKSRGEAADRAAGPRDVRGRGRRRRGQGRSRGDRRLPERPAEVPAARRQAFRAARCSSVLRAPARR